MKSHIRNILGASAATVLALSALGEETPGTKLDRADRAGHARRAERLNGASKVSDVLGMKVRNLQDDPLGKVENILLDLESGRIVAVVISSGGFLGIGDELSAVPPTALRFNAERNGLALDVSKEMLSNAPHFKANHWPDFGHPTHAGGIYRAYRVEPYFEAPATPESDATASADRALTPLDQGNSKADVDTTAQIRKDILADKAMSANGRNVKIITLDGRVTLRGPVNSADEKRAIGEIANNVARLENVDNQLEVK